MPEPTHSPAVTGDRAGKPVACRWATGSDFVRLAENAADILYLYRLGPNPGMDYINPAAERILGYAPEEFYADPDLAYRVVHPDDRPMLERRVQSHVAPGTPLLLRCFHRQGHQVWLELRETVIRDAGQRAVAVEGISRDISLRKRAEERLQAQARLLERVSGDQPLTVLLEELVRFVEEQLPGLRCSILLADKITDTLRHGVAPSLPESYNRLVDGLPIAEGMGSCGTAAARGRMVVVENIYTDRLWAAVLPRVTEHRWLQACWSTPFFSARGELLGTFAIYPEAPGVPEPMETELLQYGGSLAGLLVERRRNHEELDTFSRALEQSPAHIVIANSEGIVLFVNERFTRVTGFTAEEVEHRPLESLMVRRLGVGSADACRAAFLAGEEWQGEYQVHRKNGELYWESATLTPIRDAQGRIAQMLMVAEDITARKQAEEEIHQLAFFDPLTGLPNRRLLMDRLGQALDSARRSGRHGALLFVDLDHFKQLNDARGHAVGDELLQMAGRRLHAELRSQDTCARLGGDEFVVLLVNLTEDASRAAPLAHGVAEKLRQTLSRPFAIAGMEYQLGGSIGMTVFPKPGDSVEELLREGDTAMYRAKQEGRDAVRQFRPVMREAAQFRFALERDLRQAVTRGELETVLQPQVDQAGIITGAELLLRWHHPVFGLMAPAEFIPVAEESGLITGIDDWVLTRAAGMLRELADRGLALRLSVNISPRQFRQPDLVQRIGRCLAAAGADPDRLVVEVTERVVIDDVEDTITKMSELSALGVRFSIDDFGTGHSSLAYLKRLPLDELKINQAFVHDAPTDPHDAALVEGILSVARQLSLQVVGEGVETDEQRRFLAARNCRTYQGYLCGRPVSWQVFLNCVAAGDTAVGG